jgi:hypothetical protein
VVDDCTREYLALVADTSLSGMRVARELEALIAKRGKPTATAPSSPRTPSWASPILHVSHVSYVVPAKRGS